MNENKFNSPLTQSSYLIDHFARLGLAVLLLIVLRLASQYLLIDLARLMGLSEWMKHWSFNWVLSLVPLYGIAFPVFCFVLPKPPSARGERRPLGKARFAVICNFCLAGMIVFNFVGYYLMLLINLLSKGQLGNSDALNTIVNASPTWATVLLACVFAPAMEELIFRKLLIDRVKPYGELQACIFSALIFGLFHGNFRQFFYAAVLGFIFSYVYAKTNNIVHTIVLHSGVNLLGSVIVPNILRNKNLALLEKALNDPSAVASAELPMLFLVAATLIIGGSLIVSGAVLLIINFKKIKFDPPSLPVDGGVARFIYSAPALVAAMAVMGAMFVLALL